MMAQRTTRFFSGLLGPLASLRALQVGQSTTAELIASREDTGAGRGGGDPMTPNATFSIVVETMDAQAIAPHPQWFDVSNLTGFTPAAPAPGQTFNPQAHDVTYIWDFGDPTSVPHPACNLPTAWRNTNAAYGKRVCHVFDEPGTYSVTCWAFDQEGHYGITRTNVTVADPATVFVGNRTVCVNPVGDNDFSQAPPGAQQLQGFSGVGSAIDGLGRQTARVLLKRGGTFTGAIGWPNGAPNRYISSYGIGADPIWNHGTVEGDLISLPVGQSLYNKFVGIDYRGRWNPDTEIGLYTNFCNLVRAQALVHKCHFSGFMGFSPGFVEPSGLVVFSASHLERWRNFGVIVGGQAFATDRLAFIGTAVHQSPDCLAGQPNAYFEAKVGNSNGPVRVGPCICTFWSCSSFFSNNGWSVNGNIGDIPRTETHIQAVQGCLRLNGDNDGSYTGPIVNFMDRIVAEGGSGIITPGGEQNFTTNFVMDKVIVLGNSYAAFAWPIYVTGGCTLRNILIFWPNTLAGQSLPTGMVNANASTTNGANARRVVIYGLTFYSPITSANKARAGGSASFQLFEPNGGTPFTNHIEENNLIHLPAQNSPAVASAPISLVAIPGLTTQFRGPRWNFPTVNVTLGADVPNGGTAIFSYPDDTTLHPNGRATNQEYFLTPPGDNQHMLGITGGWATLGDLPIKSWTGQFSIVFGASSIIVTNTSGETWLSGKTLQLQLDRRNDLAPPLAQYANPVKVEVPVPLAGSPALGGAVAGLVPLDDLLCGRRALQLLNDGSEVAGIPSRGALDPLSVEP